MEIHRELGVKLTIKYFKFLLLECWNNGMVEWWLKEESV